MPGNFKKEDLRIIKTHNALVVSMRTLLERRNFNQITVNDLCEEAQISRVTFYAHFNDKYDLLRYWLSKLKPETINKDNTYEQIEETFNTFIHYNSKVIKNLVENANSETLELIHKFMFSLLGINIEENKDGKLNPKHIILSVFCAGGMVNFLSWQIKNKALPDLQVFNTYFYEILDLLHKWEADHD